MVAFVSSPIVGTLIVTVGAGGIYGTKNVGKAIKALKGIWPGGRGPKDSD